MRWGKATHYGERRVGMPVWRLISGGQTGVDRAALELARQKQIPAGGWCPKGRRAEDGAIGAEYPLQETPSAAYAERTALNVRDSDGTLILLRGNLEGGTAFTRRMAERLGKPYRLVDLTPPSDPDSVWQWLVQEQIKVLNIAGPRESKEPGIQAEALAFLRQVIDC